LLKPKKHNRREVVKTRGVKNARKKKGERVNKTHVVRQLLPVLTVSLREEWEEKRPSKWDPKERSRGKKKVRETRIIHLGPIMMTGGGAYHWAPQGRGGFSERKERRFQGGEAKKEKKKEGRGARSRIKYFNARNWSLPIRGPQEKRGLCRGKEARKGKLKTWGAFSKKC